MDERLRQNYQSNLKVLENQNSDLLRYLNENRCTGIFFEKARDGNYTCSVGSPEKKTYIYSKFKPEETARKNIARYLEQKTGNYLILGLGLGYDLWELYHAVKNDKNFNRIIVIENNPDFFYLTLHTNDYSGILSDKRVAFLIGNPKKLSFPVGLLTVIDNPQLTSLAPDFYKKIVSEIGFAVKKLASDWIVVFEHVTFADDICEAFTELGLKVAKLKLDPDPAKLTEVLKKRAPRFLFSINFDPYILQIAEFLKLPYVSWTVDTPCFSLFNEKNKSPWALLFVYESEVCERLRKNGFDNVYYLPAAANSARFDRVLSSGADVERYSCDISFVGTTGVVNEYRKFFLDHVDGYLKDLINRISVDQLNRPERYLVPELIKSYSEKNSIDITSQVYEKSLIRLGGENYIPDDERFAVVLAKEICSYWRKKIISRIAGSHEIHVYGDAEWGLFEPAPSGLKYCGQARHFEDLPGIYKGSKINLNLTRIYVESGLPMRVFDVLASGGFLLTNHKNDLDRLFKPGREMVEFYDDKEMMEAIEYYLEHEGERQEIAARGYVAVKERHTFEHRMREVLEIVENRKVLM
ncbi:glycosyltransferase family protein [Phosphitispora sp. TUW77]|uniref:CgeB family protein n=1 Tax=Phosphitispora sp. TUW77 TaxID=3152361 RepID=UPI003AB88603